MKVLIISHNPITTYQSMGKTLLSLFAEFKKTELCQLYIYPTYPDIDKCSSYYRITDKEIVSHFFRKTKCGREIDKCNIHENQLMFENLRDESLYRNPKNKTSIRRLLRDFLWAKSKWYSNELERWIEKEMPTCIFVAPGSAKFIYDIALKISNVREIPIVTYLCDEFYFVKEPKRLLDRFYLSLLKKKIEELMRHTSQIISICREMEEAYTVKFGIPACTIMTGSELVGMEVKKFAEQAKSISFFGNVRCNRYKSLLDIGTALEVINQKDGTNIELKIYTSEKNPEILKCLKACTSIKLCGFILGKDFSETLMTSDFLLHVEAFDDSSIDRVKHSISTKIADSLASGVPLIAYGPEELASMKYLKENNCAFVINKQEELVGKLQEIFHNYQESELQTVQALKTARRYHSVKKNSEELYGVLSCFEKNT